LTRASNPPGNRLLSCVTNTTSPALAAARYCARRARPASRSCSTTTYSRTFASGRSEGYQTLINAQLRASLPGAKGKDAAAITLAGLRRVLREELRPLRR